MNLDDWPFCAIVGCSNKCCLRLKSIYCWPHTRGEESFESLMERLKEEELVGEEMQ